MGKHKRTRPNHPKSSLSRPDSESASCSSNGIPTSKEISMVLAEQERDPIPSVMDVPDKTSKLPHSHTSLSHHQYNLNRSIFLKRPRHYFGRQYFRHKFGNYSGPSTSHGKGLIINPSQEERISFKLANQSNPHNGWGEWNADNKDKSFTIPEIIRASSSSIKDALSDTTKKMVCGICEKILKRKPYCLGNEISSIEFSVVAVLVCGHVYHAECLENRTCHEHRTDPLCPMCSRLCLEGDSSIVQE